MMLCFFTCCKRCARHTALCPADKIHLGGAEDWTSYARLPVPRYLTTAWVFQHPPVQNQKMVPLPWGGDLRPGRAGAARHANEASFMDVEENHSVQSTVHTLDKCTIDFPRLQSVDSVFSVAMTQNICEMTNVVFCTGGNSFNWFLMRFMSLFESE